MLTTYLPGSILSRGKLYWPWALLTTQVVMVEPACLAPMSTPSIAPSACEVTLPVSAEGAGISPITRPAKARPNKVAHTVLPARSVALLIANFPSFQVVSKQDFPVPFRMRPPVYSGNAFRSLDGCALSGLHSLRSCHKPLSASF